MRWLVIAWLFASVSVAAASRLRLKSPTSSSNALAWQQGAAGVAARHFPAANLKAAASVSASAATLLQKGSSALEGVALLASQKCDLAATGDVCYSGSTGQQHVLAAPAVPAGLQARFTFDELMPLDSSGNNLHAATEVRQGPSPAGTGHSAIFDGNVLPIPQSAGLSSQDFTYSFWVYLVADSTHRFQSSSESWCPLMRKGTIQMEAQVFQSAPAIAFQPQSGLIRGIVNTHKDSSQNGEHVTSNARLPKNRWMHLALVHHTDKKSLLLYVNGVLDSTVQLSSDVLPNDLPLYIGGDAFPMAGCEHTVYLDDLNVYGRALAPHELHAEGLAALGVDPAFALLGCPSCSLTAAAASCPEDRHICTALELHTGGYQMARGMGWVKAGVHVWTYAQTATPAGAAGQAAGLALCCEGSSP